MKTHNTENELSLNERSSIIHTYPLFSKLNPEDTHDLALLFKEIQVKPGKIIVNEGDPVDSVYLIVSGAAEVTRTVSNIDDNQIINVATLSKGDTIGLSQEGFFSTTGTRTGTVMSALSMTLLVITIHDFYQFLQKSKISETITNACENILLINFIKQTNLFRHLTKEQIQKLIEGKRKIAIPANTVLFKEGDIADKCYFVLSGEIAITSQGKQLATLKTSSILGEGAFIANERRNADAYAITDSELFVLDKMQIKMITSKMLIEHIDERRIRQLRPLPNPDVSVIQNKTPENEILITLENPINHAQLQLSKTDYVIWKNQDGRKNLETTLRENSAALKNMNINDVYARILVMANSGFLDIKRETFLHKLIKKIRLAW